MSGAFKQEDVMGVSDEDMQLSLPTLEDVYLWRYGTMQGFSAVYPQAPQGRILEDATSPTLLDEFRAFQREWEAQAGTWLVQGAVPLEAQHLTPQPRLVEDEAFRQHMEQMTLLAPDDDEEPHEGPWQAE